MHAQQPRVDAIRELAPKLNGHVVTVAALKGGSGKTTLAIELAYTLNAVLVDLDWDRGGASRQLGHYAERYVRSTLLDALESSRTPRWKGGPSRPDFVPSSPDLEANMPEPGYLAEQLRRWAEEWNRPVVVDTHPGAGTGSMAAIMAATVVVVPTVLARAELDAAEGMCMEMPDYPLLLVPYRVPPVPPGRMVERLAAIAKTTGHPVGPIVSHYGQHPTRLSRTAVTALPRPSAWAERMAGQICDVAEAVISYDR